MQDLFAMLDQKPREQDDPLGLPPNASPLDGFIAIYRNPRLSEYLRFKAMTEAAKYMHAKLSTVALVQPGEVARKLDDAIERSNRAKLINGEAKAIEAKPVGPAKLRRL